MTSLSALNRPRLEWVDYMKVLGMFLIIYGHILLGKVDNFTCFLSNGLNS